MATRTDNLKLSKAETSDGIKSTLTANNNNFDKLDGVITRLRNNQLRGTASGTEIEITDAAEMESVLKISGNSIQNGEPSPANEVLIQSVKSKSDNLFDKNTSNIIDNMYIASDGTITAESASKVFYVKVTPNTTYSFTKIKSYRFRLAQFTNEPTVGNAGTDLINMENNTEFSFTTKATTNYIAVWYYNSASDTVTEQEILNSIMLNKGTEALPYQPYGYVPVEAKVEGKNLVLWELGTVNTKTGEDTTSTTRARAKFNLVKGEEYTLNIPYSRFRNMVILDNNNNLIGNYQDLTITHRTDYTTFISSISGKAKIIISNADETTNVDLTQYNGVVQLERGSIPTQVVPYVEPTTISLSLGDIELRSTPDGTRDVFERVDGVWNKKNNVANTIVNGQNQNTSIVSSYCTENHNAFTISGIESVWNKPACKGYSNKFKVITSSSDINGKDEPNLYFGNVSKAEIWVKVSKEVAPTVADFRTWLSNNPIEIQYPLAEPIYTPVTDQALITALDELEQLILHKGYNYITATAVNGVRAHLDLSYYKDINIVLDNINASILSLGGGASV